MVGPLRLLSGTADARWKSGSASAERPWAGRGSGQEMSGGEVRVRLAMLLANQGDVPLGQRNGFGVLALAVQPAHLATEGSKVIGALRLRPHAPGGR